MRPRRSRQPVPLRDVRDVDVDHAAVAHMASAAVTSAYLKIAYAIGAAASVMTAATASAVVSSGMPSTARRNPSIRPASGFSRKTWRDPGGTARSGYRTGEANMSSWSAIGSAMPTSLTRTCTALKTSAHPNAHTARRPTMGTTSSNSSVTGTRKKRRSPARAMAPIARSMTAATTYDSGRISLGKNTFVTSWAWLTRLLAPFATAPEKKAQGRIPAYANSAYGTPSLGTRTSRANTAVKTSIIASGWRTAHSNPSRDCLYRTLMRWRLRTMRRSA